MEYIKVTIYNPCTYEPLILTFWDILVLVGAWKGAKELFLQCSKYILEKGLVQFVLQN